MISRYSLYTTADLRDRFALVDGLPKGVKPRYNIHPTLQASVIVNRGKPVVEQMSWGLVPKGAKDTNSVFRYKTYNVPSEKILAKHSWEMAVRHGRCLVPANGFYLLAEQGSKKQAYYVQLRDAPLFAFAGIYSSWDDGEGMTHSTYSIITSQAPHSLRHITDRLPIILSENEESRWLDTSVTDANALFDMLRPASSEQLPITEVGADIYSPKIDTPKLITPISKRT